MILQEDAGGSAVHCPGVRQTPKYRPCILFDVQCVTPVSFTCALLANLHVNALQAN